MHNLKPYTDYRLSGLPWVGKMPAHWLTRRGKVLFRKMSRSVRPTDEVVTCFRDGIVTLRRNRRTTGFTESLMEIGYQGVRRGDLVIHAMDAFAGAIGVSDSDGKSTPVYSVCQPQGDANSHYYAYVVREMSRNLWIAALAKGIRERSTDFRFEAFGAQNLPVPPPDEQAAIVSYLDHANRRTDRTIKAKRKVIALLNEQKQVIIHHAVTCGLDPSVRLKPSGISWIRDIPEHWVVKRIKYLLREVDNRSTTGSETLLSMRMHHGIVPFGEHFNRPPQAATLVGFKIVRPGQLVINRMQAGNGLIFTSHLHGLVSPDYAVFDPIADINADFLGELFRSRVVRAKFRAESKGLGTGTSGFLRLYNDRLGAIHVAVPPREEQNRILKELEDQCKGINSVVSKTEREMELLQEYRTRLIADVVTGKFDVRAAAARLPDDTESLDFNDVLDDSAEIDEVDDLIEGAA